MYSLQTAWYMSVLIPPGATALTVIFLSPKSKTKGCQEIKFTLFRDRTKLTNGHAPDKGLNGALAARVDGVLGDTLGLAGDGAH